MSNPESKNVTARVGAQTMKASVQSPKIIIEYWRKHPKIFWLSILLSLLVAIGTGYISYKFPQNFWLGIVIPSALGFIAAVIGLIILPPYKHKVKEITQT